MVDRSNAAARRRKAERRADVLRRYVRLGQPTAEQTASHAAEFGVSHQRLQQLAAAWRIHGEAVLDGNKARNDVAKVARAIEAAEGPLDMSGILPSRRAETERRIRLVGRYLRSNASGLPDRHDYVADFGASYGAFRRAVTSWIITPHPSAFPGRRRGEAPYGHDSGTNEYDAAVLRAMDELGHQTGIVEIHRRVTGICREEGFPPPSLGLVRTRMFAVRARRPVAAPPEEALRIDRVVVALHLDDLTYRSRVLTILFGAISGRIHAHRLSPDVDAASDAGVILDRVIGTASMDCHHTALLEWSAPKGDRWTRLRKILSDARVAMKTGRNRQLASGIHAFPTMGSLIHDLPIRRLDRRSRALLEPDSAIALSERAFVSAAIARHNEGRGAPATPLVHADARGGLIAALTTLIG